MRSHAAPAVRSRVTAPTPIRDARLSRQARAAKALLVAVLSTLIALTSHVLAGGTIPALPGILVPLALSVLVCLPLSGRVLSLPRLALSVLASQLLFHSLFVLGATAPGVHLIDNTPPGHAPHHLQTITMLHPAAEPGAGMSHSDGWMWVAHAVAAVLTILLIRRGETALVGLGQLVTSLVRALFPPLPRADALPSISTRLAGDFPDDRATARWMLTASISRRGPPRSSLLALS